jgi:hypothetical protein
MRRVANPRVRLQRFALACLCSRPPRAGAGNTLAHPFAINPAQIASPELPVVRKHELIRDTRAEARNDPILEIVRTLRLRSYRTAAVFDDDLIAELLEMLLKRIRNNFAIEVDARIPRLSAPVPAMSFPTNSSTSACGV